ncbi:MAG: molybdopterin molybdotransferase MoeA [Methanoregulaceae archaeon]|nr:molybdopterin molybdotransferase MoeA [Methanoregulaceae archaeon]
MISYEEAVDHVRGHAWISPLLLAPITESVGHQLVAPIVAHFDSPVFDNSAMDGFAVYAGGPPWRIVGEIAAGSVRAEALAPGTAVRIFTGAPIPEGTDAVLPIELAEVRGDELSGQIAPGRHIRRRAEEYAAGQVLLERGVRINPGIVATMAANGMRQVAVDAPPRVGVLATGSELVPPGEPLWPGQIYDSNQPTLISAAQALGCTVEGRHTNDDPDLTRQAAEALLDSSDVLLTVGGVSVGAHDYVRPTIQRLGFEQIFSGVAIKPGKPVSFGVRDDGKVWFGLPGNPRSALVTFILFVREWMGCGPQWHPCVLAHDLAPAGDRETFELACWSGDVRVFESVGSHAVGGWAEANALVRVPAGSQLRAGDPIQTTLDLWHPTL